MANIHYIHYLNFPKIPDSIINKLSLNPKDYDIPNEYSNTWSAKHADELNNWARDNVCPTLRFGFQMFSEEPKLHKDPMIASKLIYLISPGGNDVFTEFYSEDQSTLLRSYKVEPFRWCSIQTDVWHRVINIDPNQVRFAVASSAIVTNDYNVRYRDLYK